MAEFSATEVAFTGFRVVRENPVAVAIWAGLQFIYALALNVFIAATAGGPFTALAHMQAQMARQSQPDLSQALTLMRQLAPTSVAVLVSFLVLVSVLAAAMNRAVTRPQDRAFGYLRLAGEELRQLGLFALVVLLDLAIFWTVALVGSMLLMMASLAAGQVSSGAAVAFTQGAVIASIAFFAVRLSLASPMTFATGRIAVLTAWPLSRGRFWRLVGAYAIAGGLALVVLVLMNAIGLGALAALGGEAAIKSAAETNLTSIAAVLTAPRLVEMVIDSIGWALIVPIVLCPPIAIYRALAGEAH